MPIEYFFAYGTLQAGGNTGFFEEHNLEQYLSDKGQASAKGHLLHLHNTEKDIDYPGLIPSHDKSIVFGTLYEIRKSKEVFKIMDEWEGYTPGLTEEQSELQNFYQRTMIKVQTKDTHEEKIASAYILNRESTYFKSEIIFEAGDVASGDWLQFIQYQ